MRDQIFQLVINFCLAFGADGECAMPQPSPAYAPTTRAKCALVVVQIHRDFLKAKDVGRLPSIAGIEHPIVGASCVSVDALPPANICTEDEPQS